MNLILNVILIGFCKYPPPPSKKNQSLDCIKNLKIKIDVLLSLICKTLIKYAYDFEFILLSGEYMPVNIGCSDVLSTNCIVGQRRNQQIVVKG